MALALVYFTTSLPFMVSGAIVSLAIGETMEKVGRVYFFDLAGAAAGCFLLLALLPVAGGPGAVIGAAITFATAGAIWHSLAGNVRARAGSVALALGMMAFLVYNQKHPVLDVRNAKGQPIANEVFHQWNSFSRVAVTRQPGGEHMIVIDADAATAIARVDFDHLTAGQVSDLREQGPALPYDLRPGAKTLVIGPGGGWDVARAHRRRQPRRHGGGDQPDHLANHHARAFSRVEQRLIPAPGRALVRGGRAQFCAGLE